MLFNFLKNKNNKILKKLINQNVLSYFFLNTST